MIPILQYYTPTFPSPYGVRSFQTILFLSNCSATHSVSVPLRGEVISNAVVGVVTSVKEAVRFPSPYGVRSFQTRYQADPHTVTTKVKFPSPYGVRSFQTEDGSVVLNRAGLVSVPLRGEVISNTSAYAYRPP